MIKFISLFVLVGLCMGMTITIKAASFIETTAIGEKVAASQKLQLANFLAGLNRKEIELLLHRRLSLAERISLKIMQHRLTRELKQNDLTMLFSVGKMPLNPFVKDARKSIIITVVLLWVLLVLLTILLLSFVVRLLPG